MLTSVPAQHRGMVVTAVVLASLAGVPPGLAQDAGRMRLTGSVPIHVVARGDSLAMLGARFGIDTRTLAADTVLPPPTCSPRADGFASTTATSSPMPSPLPRWS